MKKPVLLQGGPASGKNYYFWNLMQLQEDLGFNFEHIYAKPFKENKEYDLVELAEVFKENDVILVDCILYEQQITAYYHMASKHNCWLFIATQQDLDNFSKKTLAVFNIIQFGYDERRNSYRIYESSKIPA